MLPQQMHSVVTDLASRGIVVLPLTLPASVLGTSSAGGPKPGPVTCFSPGTGTSARQRTLSAVATAESCLAFPHISALHKHPATDSLQAGRTKRCMSP